MKRKIIATLITASIMLSGSTVFAADSSNEARIKEIEAQIAELQTELECLKAEEKKSNAASQDLESVETSYILTAGNYTAGIDIPVGKCNVSAISGQGNISSTNIFNGGINEMFGIDDGTGLYTASFNGLKLPEEVVLTTNGKLVVQLDYSEITGAASGRIYDEAKAIEFSNGIYQSGKDFQVGTYNILAVSGTGNLSSSNLYDGGINEMFGIDDGTGLYNDSVNNVSLPDGVELNISGGLTVKLIPEA